MSTSEHLVRLSARIALGLFVLACGLAGATSAQAQVISGSYVGNGVDNTVVDPLGFQPDVVIVKGDTIQVAVIRTSTMSGDLSKPITNLALTANLIQSLDSNGFTIGTDATVNATGVTYHWIAFKANAGTMKLGSYTGNGTGQSFSGFNFSPEFVIVLPALKEVAHGKIGAIQARGFYADGGGANRITSLNADGFTVGSSSLVNTSGDTYHYIAWNEVANYLKIGSYTGNATDNRSISGIGFQTEYVVVMASGINQAVVHFQILMAARDSSRSSSSDNSSCGRN